MTGTISISRTSVVNPLNAAASLVDGKVIPILGYLRLDASGQSLSLKSTNLDMWLIQEVQLEHGTDAASYCIEGGRLADFVRRLPENSIITLSEGNKGLCRIVSAESRYNLPTLPIEDFPSLQPSKAEYSLRLSAKKFADMITGVRICASADNITRQCLCGVHLRGRRVTADGPISLCAEATDGHRMAQHITESAHGASDALDVIIPRKTVDFFLKLLAGKAGEVRLEIAPNTITLALEGISCVSKLIDGTFPDCDRLISISHDHAFTVSSPALQKAVERLNILQTERDFLRRVIKLEVADGKLSLSVNDKSGEGSESLLAEVVGDPESFCLNSRYLTEALSQIHGDAVTFQMNGSSGPIVLKDTADMTSTHLIMPIRP